MQQERAGRLRSRGSGYGLAINLLHVLVHIDGAVDHYQPDQRDRNKPDEQRCHVSSLTPLHPVPAGRTAQGQVCGTPVEIVPARDEQGDTVGDYSAELHE